MKIDYNLAIVAVAVILLMIVVAISATARDIYTTETQPAYVINITSPDCIIDNTQMKEHYLITTVEPGQQELCTVIVQVSFFE